MTWLFAEAAKVGTALRKASAKANVEMNAWRIRDEIIIAVVASFHLPFKLRPTFLPRPCAVATMYHAGQTSDQFRVHTPLPFEGRIINVVIAIARKIAKARLIRINRKAWRTPQIAGRRKRNRQRLEREGSLNRTRQNKHGKQDEAKLTPRVRRDSDPMTKPQAQEQPISSRPRQSNCKKSS
jgi:hypothetical protein